MFHTDTGLNPLSLSSGDWGFAFQDDLLEAQRFEQVQGVGISWKMKAIIPLYEPFSDIRGLIY
jgi:hypothetical protein